MNPIITHLCLVSAQPVPNLTPLLDPASAPERVILLVSEDMQPRAGWLEQVLRPRGLRVSRWPIDQPWDIEGIQTRVLELLEQEQGAVQAKSLALNATGGTKPMSIAAYEAFRAYDLPIFYVHPEQDRLIWMHPNTEPSLELADRIRLEPFLLAHGAKSIGELRRTSPLAGQRHIATEIIANIDHFSKSIATLNWLAAGAERSLRSCKIDHDRGALAQLIDLFEEGGLLHREQGALRFPDEAARFFVNGGWIEGYVFDLLRDLRSQGAPIQDMACGVNVERQQRGRAVPNELDLALLRDNRLHIIECKTKRFRGNGEDSPGAEALYKLDSLRDLMGGLQARAMLVSYQNLPDHDRTRAADLGIRVCAGVQLRRLREQLKDFIG